MNEQTTRRAQIKAGLEIIKAIADTIRELKEVPSGELYARIMGQISFENYQAVIGTLKRAWLVKVENHLLIWVEPK